ncbi:fumarylacetoacetate hydrolase family protein [Neisseriaceae bacterium TC5R-5]|nr:fumarylacetoacetate hydrolase family protein [Neisseriaceae bacterium TC5R-5]
MSAVQLTVGQQSFTVGNIFCIGRNYAAHAAELGNAVESEPLVFLKPTSALIDESSPLQLPDYSSDVHHECELVLLIGEGGRDIAAEHALSHIAAYGLGLDMTARDIQSLAKSKGHPWTKAKGFPSAATISHLLPAADIADPQQLHFQLHVNEELRQHGDTRLMLFPITTIISYLSRTYGLQRGDLVYTGTPEGVAAVKSQDRLRLSLGEQLSAHWSVA